MRLSHPRILIVCALILGASAARAEFTDHRVFLMHDPIYPRKSETVTLSVEAPSGVATINEIVVREYHLTGSSCGAPPGCLIRTHTEPCSGTSCTYTKSGGYDDNRMIRYHATVQPATGPVDNTPFVEFAAGAYPWPDMPIPIYKQTTTSDAIDLLFIPDEDYGGGSSGNLAFRSHVHGLINRSLFSTMPFSEKIRHRRDKWNLYLTYQQGNAVKPVGFCNLNEPPDWLTMRAIVDDGIIVHNECMRDCATNNELASAEHLEVPVDNGTNECPGAEERLVVPVHELGHVAFILSDEYGGPPATWPTLAHRNVFPDRRKCVGQTSNTPPGRIQDRCRRVSSGLWRSDHPDDIMRDVSSTDFRFGFNGQDRADWIYNSCHSC